jgi:hypothetical protein
MPCVDLGPKANVDVDHRGRATQFVARLDARSDRIDLGRRRRAFRRSLDSGRLELARVARGQIVLDGVLRLAFSSRYAFAIDTCPHPALAHPRMPRPHRRRREPA